jgi:hypothetical protein
MTLNELFSESRLFSDLDTSAVASLSKLLWAEQIEAIIFENRGAPKLPRSKKNG